MINIYRFISPIYEKKKSRLKNEKVESEMLRIEMYRKLSSEFANCEYCKQKKHAKDITP